MFSIETHFDLVWKIAKGIKRKVPQHVELDDLVQAGMVGLVEAGHRYRPEQGDFKGFAMQRIRGAILDELRGMDPLPRGTRKAIRRFHQEDGHLSAVQTRLMVAAKHVQLETVIDEDGHTFADAIPSRELSPLDAALVDERDTQIRLRVQTLPEGQRQIMQMLYWRRMKMQEIGDAMGICESRVSQLHKNALNLLRGFPTKGHCQSDTYPLKTLKSDLSQTQRENLPRPPVLQRHPVLSLCLRQNLWTQYSRRTNLIPVDSRNSSSSGARSKTCCRT